MNRRPLPDERASGNGLQMEASSTEEDILAQWGFTSEEIASLLWLKQWYQHGGSDRAVILRHLEFLRLLVRTGELEV